MKNLGKDHIQKIALGSLMAIGVVYGYFDFLLGPLRAKTRAIAIGIAALDPEINKANAQMLRAKAIAKDAPPVEASIASINALIPEGSPVAWFPVRINELFKKAGSERATTKLTAETPEKELNGYRRVTWAIDLPLVECMAFGAAVAELENQEPLVEIQSIAVETLRENPEAQRALLTVNNIVK